MNIAKYVFAGSPLAQAITGMLSGATAMGLFVLSDSLFTTSTVEGGTVKRWSYQTGVVSQGFVNTPKPNEQGALTAVVTASPGYWLVEVRTHEGTRLIRCDREPSRPGEKMLYRLDVGWYTGTATSLPACV